MTEGARPYFDWRMPLWAIAVGAASGGVLGVGLAPQGERRWLALAVLGWFAFVNLVPLLLYGWDKLAAIKRWRRISENLLIWFSALGGFAGAWIASRLFHHKTIDRVFLVRRLLVAGPSFASFCGALLALRWDLVIRR